VSHLPITKRDFNGILIERHGLIVQKTPTIYTLWHKVFPVRYKWALSSLMKTVYHYPVTDFSQDKLRFFIKELNCRLDFGYARLLTSDEWLDLATAGGVGVFSGHNNIDEVAWYDQNTTKLRPVGLLRSNDNDLYDMSGNVYEIVGPLSNNTVECRGGSYKSSWPECKSTHIKRLRPVDLLDPVRSDEIGFRLAVEPI